MLEFGNSDPNVIIDDSVVAAYARVVPYEDRGQMTNHVAAQQAGEERP